MPAPAPMVAVGEISVASELAGPSAFFDRRDLVLAKPVVAGGGDPFPTPGQYARQLTLDRMSEDVFRHLRIVVDK